MLNFEVVKRRQSVTIVEKYDFPVLSIHPEAIPLEGQTRAVQKFELNEAASKLFTYVDGINYVGLAYMQVEDTKRLVIVNFKDDASWKMAKFNKDNSFNSKQMFNLLQEELKFDRTILNEYRISHHIDEESGVEFITLDEPVFEAEIIPENTEEVEEVNFEDAILLED